MHRKPEVRKNFLVFSSSGVRHDPKWRYIVEPA